MSDTPDIVIVGGGMAGLSMAAALAPLPVRIRVLDPVRPPAPDTWPAGVDLRVSALTHASQHLLESIGAWSHMQALRVSPYHGMQVWDAEGTGSIAFDAASSGVTHLGHLVENRVTVQGLLCALEACDNVDVVHAGMASLMARGDRYEMLATDGERYRPALLVGADGAQSMVRDQAGLPVRRWSYGQQAIVTTIVCERPHRSTCWQIFTAEGPLALLPLDSQDDTAGHLCSVVWSQNDERAHALMALDEAAFATEMTRALEQRLGAIRLVDRRVVFPLVQRHAVDYVCPGLALVGDAAHNIHPLAGQGINLGFMDVATLSEELSHDLARGLPLAHESTLRRFQRRRKSANLTMMAAMEAFRRGYGQSHWALQVVRNWGMGQVDRHTHLKQWIVEHAMGLRGDIPAPARPALRVTL